MSAVLPLSVANHLIECLPRAEGQRFFQLCEPVELGFGTIVCEANRAYADVYFPQTAFISLVKVVDGHPPLEIALIGSEGMLGATLALGVEDAPLRGVVQGSGTALRMSALQFRRELHDNTALLKTLNRYLYVTTEQLAQTAACTHFHEIETRLVRWLLMTHDRAHADQFHLTHKFLADMLGVQRSAITIAAGALQKRNFIHYTRGEITILDRKGLEAAACSCYRAMIDAYTDIFN